MLSRKRTNCMESFKTLEETDVELILQAFNASFCDYFVPLNFTKEQLEAKMNADNTDLKLSVGAFENDQLAAFILHGLREVDDQKLIYNGGTGGVPEKRGHSLNVKKYEFITPKLKSAGIHKIILEVIDKNVQTKKSYERVGYKKIRELVCYKGDVIIYHINPDIEIVKLDTHNWEQLKKFWDFTPTWQNAETAIENSLHGIQSYGAYVNKTLVGYTIYNKLSKRLHQIAVLHNMRRKKVASTLLAYVITTNSNQLSIINVDTTSNATNTFLKKVGFVETIKQFEMEMKLI